MKIKGGIWQSVLIVVFVFCLIVTGAAAEKTQDIPVKGMVTMVELGAGNCIPCRMMESVIKNVKKAYKDRAAIISIDIRENREQAVRFGIRMIPTQIFFDKKGKEVFRHTGFMREMAIDDQLRKMGVEKIEKKGE